MRKRFTITCTVSTVAVQTKRFNIPMALTWARIAFIPLIVGVFYVPDWIAGPHVKNLLACVMFVIAAVTDALDGLRGLRGG